MSNWVYVGLAYGLTWGVLIVYALSIATRTRRLQSELKS
jgi:hypothetical protein